MHFTCKQQAFILYSFIILGRELTVNFANAEIFNSSNTSSLVS